MSNVVDLFTKQPVKANRTVKEWADWARGVAPPDYVKRRGVMVMTDETHAPTVALLEGFGFESVEQMTFEVVFNSWAWLGAEVATSLYRIERGDIDFHVPASYEPFREQFRQYVYAIAENDISRAKGLLSQMGLLTGMEDGHPFTAIMDIGG